LLLLLAVGCGSSGDAPPGVSLALSSDDSHACAGAVSLKVTVSEVGGDEIETEVPAAVSPDQLDCDFSQGVAEAFWALPVGELDTGISHVAQVELLDSLGTRLAFGASGQFQPERRDEIDPVEVELSRVAALGTVLLDLLAEPAFSAANGELSVVVKVGTDALSTKRIDWPGEAARKRPLRISGLAGYGLFLDLSVQDGDGTEVAGATTETFSFDDPEIDPFVTPTLE
jgi:hypothetical protein